MPTFDPLGFDSGFDIGLSPQWGKILRQFQRIPTPRRFTVDGVPSMVVDGVEARVDVFTTHFETIKKAVEK
jgi:hypothetical protein